MPRIDLHRSFTVFKIKSSPVPLLLVVLLSAANSVNAQNSQSDLITAFASRINPLKAAIHDRFVSEEELRKMTVELEDILSITNELSRGLREQDVNRQILDIQKEVIPLLAFARERLPEEDSAENQVVRRAARTGIGVPQFATGKLVSQLADDASKAQYRLSRHLSARTPNPSETSKLMAHMILAQEALAWEVGWPFTAEEIEKIKASKGEKLTEEVYLSRRDRGVERINQRIKEDYERVGRTPPPDFVIHSSDDAEVQRLVKAKLEEVRGISYPWMKNTTTFDENEQLVLLGKKQVRQEPEPVAQSEPAASSEAFPDPEFGPTADEPKDASPARPVEKPKPVVRTWTSTDGSFRVEAEFLSLIGGTVRLKRTDSGETVDVRLSQLSNEDREFVRSLKKR